MRKDYKIKPSDFNLIRNIRKLWKHRRRYTLQESIIECTAGAAFGTAFALILIFG